MSPISKYRFVLEKCAVAKKPGVGQLKEKLTRTKEMRREITLNLLFGILV